ncbi:hypothetical protein AAC387_Pa04g2628 [Persea americana]
MQRRTTAITTTHSHRSLFRNHFLLLLSMASFLSLLSLLLLFFLYFPSSATTSRHNPIKRPTPNQPPVSPEIRQACKATQFPDLCESALSKAQLPNTPKPIDIILTALQISSKGLKTAQSMGQSILASANDNKNLSGAAKNCIEFLDYSQYRISLSASPQILPQGRTKDAKAWMSAALLYQYDCFSALKYVNTSQRVNDAMSFLISLTELTSNALSMIFAYDFFGAETAAAWKPPMTERTGFWGDGSGSGGAVPGFRGGFPSALKADVTVCKVGDGCYRTVQSAVDAAPENINGSRRFVIYIKEGVYDEIVRVPLEKKNVVFLGDGMGKTVITGKLYSGLPGISTYNTATVGVNGDGFMARDLTFENTAGPDSHQAVAFRLDSDLSVIDRCEFLGHQDTLYAHSLRQFYSNCRVAGTVDFVFGNSATFFKDSVFLLQPRQQSPEKGENNAVTAQGRTDPAQSTGFVFQGCLINGTEEYMQLYYKNPKVHKNYLGRPWKEYSRTVFIHCTLEALIRSEGWLPWSGNFALSTLYYGEFENSGAGAETSGRVSWSNQIPAEHVAVYSVENFIQGHEWIPSDPTV